MSFSFIFFYCFSWLSAILIPPIPSHPLQALFSDGISGFPWYLYAGAGGFLFLFGKTVANIATDMIKAIEVEEEADAAALLAKEKEVKKWCDIMWKGREEKKCIRKEVDDFFFYRRDERYISQIFM